MKFGIDTSVLVRLLVGEPSATVAKIRERLLEAHRLLAPVTASDVVIAEAYYALKYHYALDSAAIRQALLLTLTSGLIRPEAGSPVIEVLRSKISNKAGFVDRLIQARYERAGLATLTVDRAQSKLGNAQLIR